MAEVAISQLQEWTFAKSLARAERADSASGSPELYAPEPLEIPAKIEETPALDSASECVFQDRYLSSEEDLSPMEPDFDESDFDDDEVFEVVEAQAVAAPAQRMKPCDMAVTVSYVSAGRAKIVNVPVIAPPRLDRLRSASIAVPTAAVHGENKLNRLSLSSSTDSRPSNDHRRRSVSFGNPVTIFQNNTSMLSISSSSEGNSAWTGSTSPTNSPRRPSTSRSLAQAARNSFQIFAKPSTYFAPQAQSPSSHSFLNSDPFSDGVTSAASPTIKQSSTHKRLRSISRSLALAKIAISKPKTSMPADSPLTTPRTPMSPEIPKPSSNVIRRKLVPRGANEREPILEIPPVPTEMDRSTEALSPLDVMPLHFSPPRHRMKLVPRGADERAAPLELPPFPLEDDDDDMSIHGSREVLARKTKLRKRKSLLGLV